MSALHHTASESICYVACSRVSSFSSLLQERGSSWLLPFLNQRGPGKGKHCEEMNGSIGYCTVCPVLTECTQCAQCIFGVQGVHSVHRRGIVFRQLRICAYALVFPVISANFRMCTLDRFCAHFWREKNNSHFWRNIALSVTNIL